MADEAQVVDVGDDTFFDEIEDKQGVAMVDFWAEWCGPCRMVSPVVEELAQDYADQGVRVAKVDVDNNPSTASRFGIRSIPSILFFKDGTHVDTVVGAVPKPQLEERLKEHLA